MSIVLVGAPGASWTPMSAVNDAGVPLGSYVARKSCRVFTALRMAAR